MEWYERQPYNVEHFTLFQLLRLSVAKWEGVLAGAQERGATDCPLCCRFLAPDDAPSSEDCIGCPIYEETGEKYCRATPYADYATQHRPEGKLEAAQRELEFLQRLLQKYATQEMKKYTPLEEKKR